MTGAAFITKKIDQNLFTVYRPKKQPRLSNQFTNRGDAGGNQSFEYS